MLKIDKEEKIVIPPNTMRCSICKKRFSLSDLYMHQSIVICGGCLEYHYSQ